MVQIEDSVDKHEYRKNEKTTLLQKYDMPLEHLEYNYIENCTNGKELERIVRILRSGEEGHFPHLLEKAEIQLQKIKPYSKLLRTEEPASTQHTLSAEEWNNVSKDLQEWSSSIQQVDLDLQKNQSKIKLCDPAIRKIKILTTNDDKNKLDRSKGTRISSCDYAAWDKYDPDTELLKDEIKEEKYKNELKAEQQNEKKKKSVSFKLDHMLSDTESIILANKEKDCGNDSYRSGDYQEAEIFYTKSILIKPTVAAYNNRCITNFKLKKYSEALKDSEAVLEFEPHNIKALVRKAQIFQAMGECSNAAATLEYLISLEPNNTFAQNLLSDIQKSLPKKNEHIVRLMIEECDDNSKQKVAELDNIKTNTVEIKSNYTELFESKIKLLQENNVVNNLNENDSTSKQTEYLNQPNFATKRIEIPIPSTSKYCGPSLKIIEVPVLLKLSKEDNNDNTINNNNDNKIKEYTNNKNTEQYLNRSQKEMKIHIKNSDRIEKCDSHHSNESTVSSNKIVKINHNKQIDDLKSCGEPFPQSTYHFINTPHEFIKLWKAVQDTNDINAYACLLRRIQPSNLSFVIGNQLDSAMLSSLLKCLENQFLVANQIQTVSSFILHLCNLPRFNIIAMFMDENDIILFKNILSFLQQHDQNIPGDIIQLITQYI